MVQQNFSQKILDGAQHIISQMLTYEEATVLSARAAKVFTPSTPITSKALFAGRWEELTAVSDAVNQVGLHAVIYGERGVGKSSLANVIRPTVFAIESLQAGSPGPATGRLIVKVNANSGDSFTAIWERLFAEVSWNSDKKLIGLAGASKKERLGVRQVFQLKDTIDVEDVRRVLVNLNGSVFIVDEFDRAAKATSAKFTDLIKALSDYAVDATIVLVGVSSTVDQLIADHASIARAITQVLLPRMESSGLHGILDNARKQLGIGIENEAANMIVRVSQGLPHYTHLLGLNSTRAAAMKRFEEVVTMTDVVEGMKQAIKHAEQTVSKTHETATHSSHHDALYKEVLLACALTATTSSQGSGFFSPGSVVQSLGKVLDRNVTIATFSNHLSEFTQPKRGSVLIREGQERSYRYRFSDPLLVPYIFMDAVSRSLLTDADLSEIFGE